MLASLERAAARSEIGGSPQTNAQTTGPCRGPVCSAPVSSSHVIQALGPRSHASMEIERPAHPCVTPVCASSAPDVPPSVAALLEVLDPVWAAAEEDLLREVPMPTERPSVTVPVPAGFAGPPHLCPEDPAVCPVHPDGYCMYSCAVACENASEWLHTHDERGLGRTPEMRRRDLEAAQTVRRRMCSAALGKGDANVAARLSLDGPAGYPGLDDVPLLSNVLGGAVIVQCGDIQCLHGAGPLVAHLVSRTVLDGANHQTQHWDLLQSWYPRLPRVDVNVAPVTPHIVDMDSVEQQHPRAPDEPQVLANRRAIGGGPASESTFQEMFGALERVMQRDENMCADSDRGHTSLVSEADRMQRLIADMYPHMHPRVQHLALVAVHVYKLRLMSVWLREHVMLAHVILGKGEELLRAHERCTYV